MFQFKYKLLYPFSKNQLRSPLFFILTIIISIHSSVDAQSHVKKALKTGESNQIKKIMIDAGHGGKDSGCLGSYSKEKDISLTIALKLGQEITKKFKNIEVLYTRKDDTFVPLFERINMANEASVDLFISIHCNYAKNKKVKGSETFVMGLHRAEENLNVAKRENEVILLENDHEITYDGFDPSSTEGHIILSMYQNLYLDQSIDFASKVETSMPGSKLSVSRGVKQAGFVVLRRATMPAVLIETGFLSNSDEEKYLNSEVGQNEIVSSISTALGKYSQQIESNEQPEVAKSEQTKKTISQKSTENDVVKKQTITKKTEENIFRLQIAAMKSKTSDYDHIPQKLGYRMTIVEENGWLKYQVGNFLSREDAFKAKKRLAELGFEQSFVVKAE